MQLRTVAILCALGVVAYLPALTLPFVDDDDYVQIPLAGRIVAAGIAPLWNYPEMRTRITHVVLNGILDRVFGFVPAPFYVFGIVMHAACTLLLYALLLKTRWLDEAGAFFAAAFFAVQQGHQEAVMWISAHSELLMFGFGIGACLAWEQYLRTNRLRWFAAALASFLLAAASKESFVIFPLLMLLRLLGSGTRKARVAWTLLPFFLIVALYVLWSWLSRVGRAGYSDDRFIVSAHFFITLLRSLARLCFPWGFVALIVALLLKRFDWRRALLAKEQRIAALWMALALLPYSFLTYMPAVASRHTYLASAGLAVWVGLAATLLNVTHPRLFRLAAACVVLINIEILWVKKTAQFQERAEPYVLLRAAGTKAAGTVTVLCVPFSAEVARDVLATSGAIATSGEPPARDDHCFSVEYTDRWGKLNRENRRLRSAVHGAFY